MSQSIAGRRIPDATLDTIGASIGGEGWDGPDPPDIWPGWSRGVRVPVNYPQTPLIKQVLYLYCMMDTAENINVWHSLAWTRSN